jgi:hypothetical protein
MGQEGKQQEGRREGSEGKESGKHGERKPEEEGWEGEAEQQSQEGGGERRPRMRELVKEGVTSRVGLEGKGVAKDTFANCLKDSGGDLLWTD